MKVSVLGSHGRRVYREELILPDKSPVSAIFGLLGEPLRSCWQQAEGFAIWGQSVTLETLLQPGDRVECLQPLQADPKDARRLRVEGLRRAQAEQGQFDRWTRSR